MQHIGPFPLACLAWWMAEGRSNSTPRMPGCASSSAASRCPTPPPTSHTVPLPCTCQGKSCGGGLRVVVRENHAREAPTFDGLRLCCTSRLVDTGWQPSLLVAHAGGGALTATSAGRLRLSISVMARFKFALTSSFPGCTHRGGGGHASVHAFRTLAGGWPPPNSARSWCRPPSLRLRSQGDHKPTF
jgi:hypothetical protein